jgi:AcrR family transcriptional regulator
MPRSPSPHPDPAPAAGKQPHDAGQRAPGPGLIWIRPAAEQPKRPTRDDIVAAAIDLADAEGLQAVSIRRVAAALRTRPMGLYSHIARKDDLLDLMLDQVLGEVLVDQLPGDWRQALRAIAQHTRATARRHPWIIGVLGQRPTIGPNGMRHREQSLAAVAGLDVDLFRKGALLEAVDAYTIGHVTMELAERETQRRERLSGPQWRTAMQAYLQRLLDSGDLPHLAGPGLDAGPSPADQQRRFDAGLDWLLTGFTTTLADGSG